MGEGNSALHLGHLTRFAPNRGHFALCTPIAGALYVISPKLGALIPSSWGTLHYFLQKRGQFPLESGHLAPAGGGGGALPRWPPVDQPLLIYFSYLHFQLLWQFVGGSILLSTYLKIHNIKIHYMVKCIEKMVW